MERNDDYKSDDPDDFSVIEGLKMIMNQSVWPIIGMLFHPSYMMVNAVILGKI
jgi:hypothetical protein